jgi:hypothetical protein
MKSLILGFINFSKRNSEFDKSLELFSLDGKRKLKKIKSNSVLLFHFAGIQEEYIFENEEFLIVFSGEPFFQCEFIEFINKFDFKKFSKQVLEVKGLFSCVILDKKNNDCKVYNDYYGLFPLFYFKNGESFIFCNEYQPILAFNDNSKKLDYLSINQYFKYGFVFKGNTFFRNIKMLNQRNQITFENGVIKISGYNSIKSNPSISDYSKSVENTFYSLKIAMKRLLNEVKLKETKVSLSGGLDTRFILGLMSENEKSKLTFNSFFLSPLNEENDRDIIIAKQIAKHFNLNHEIDSFSLLTDKLVPDFFNDLRQFRNYNQITGLIGGELLSGVLFNIYSKNTLKRIVEYQEITRNKSILNRIKLFFDKQNKDLFNELNNQSTQHNNLYEYGFFVLTQSFFTTVYNGSEGMWVHPWSQCVNYSSPFFDTDFLQSIFNVPDKFIYDNNHQFYFDLLNLLPIEMKSFKTNSFLSNLEQNGFKKILEGYEQKTEKFKKSNQLFSEYFEMIKTQPFYDSNFEKEDQFEQKVIDIMCWKLYIDKL